MADSARLRCFNPLIWLLAAGLLALPAVAAESAPASQPASQPAAWDYEQYFAAYLGGRRAGYFTERERRRPDGRIETFLGRRLTVIRGGAVMTLVRSDTRVETPDGKPVSLMEYELAGQRPVQRRGEILAGQLRLVTVQDDRELARTQPWDDSVIFAHALRARMMERLKADGDSFEFSAYDSDRPNNGFSRMTLKRVGWEQVQIADRQVRALHVTETDADAPTVAHTWLNDRFRVVAFEVVEGPTFTVRGEACSKEFAQSRFAATEVYAASLVHVLPALPDPAKVRSMRLTLTFKRALDEPLDLPQTDRQTVVQSTRQRVVLDLHRPDYPPAPAGRPTTLPEQLRAYLQPAEMFDIRDGQIQRAAKMAVAGLTDPLLQARAIRDWVDKRLVFKDLGVGVATASEVIRTQRGDCTEHSVLLVAVARAAGIPARTVNGLVYVAAFGSERGVLGGHQWAQLHIRGKWVDFDAAIEGAPATACRIAFVLGEADGKQDPRAAAGLMWVFDNVASATAEKVVGD